MRAMCHKCRNEVDEWEYGHDGYFYCFSCAEKLKKEARDKIRKEVLFKGSIKEVNKELYKELKTIYDEGKSNSIPIIGRGRK